MKLLLISTYELGRQPFGLASPASWLRAAGFDVTLNDLSQVPLDEEAVRASRLVCFYLPMHTATRIALRAIAKVRALNPSARICAYGLYAPMNEALLRESGADFVLGAEFEAELVNVAHAVAAGSDSARNELSSLAPAPLPRLTFLVPDRSGMTPLAKYAHLVLPDGSNRVVGYTEATRGCKHLCRHCPIVPVYNGVFRAVQKEVVMADIRQQVEAGAQHITFGDPDFFNGPTHAMEIVRALHREFPPVSYDVTIKVEHLLKHRALLPELRDTGCAFVISAVESVDDHVLAILDKGHTRDDFARVAAIMRDTGLPLSPTFVAFTPWTTLESFSDLLRTVAELDLVENVSPVQWTIRLLIPAGSRLLELDEVRAAIGEFDRSALGYLWRNPNPRVDALQRDLARIVDEKCALRLRRVEIFRSVWRATQLAMQSGDAAFPDLPVMASRATIPFLTEPWYC